VVPDLRYRERVGRLARDLGVWLLIGTVDYREAEGEARPVNAAVLVGPDGSLGGAYAKMHLVPFGEYVPWSRYLGFVNRIVEGAIGDFLPGAAPVVLDAGDIRIGASICYEVIFPDLIRGFPLRGANLLANLTNDAWFGTSAGPRQHFAMAVVRAVENRRYLVRAANTGISGLVDPRGRVLDRTGMEESRVLVGEVRLRGDLPPAARAGAVPEILCAILAAAALAATMLPARPSSREGHRR
jgi:apolipoprotein N-acyltransferase